VQNNKNELESDK